MYEAQFSLKGETKVPPSNLCELYCMYTSRWKTCKFGIVAHDFPTSMSFRKYSDSSSILKVWITVTDNDNDVDNTGWLSRKEFHRLLNRNERRSALVVDNNVTLTLMVSNERGDRLLFHFQIISWPNRHVLHIQRVIHFLCPRNKSPWEVRRILSDNTKQSKRFHTWSRIFKTRCLRHDWQSTRSNLRVKHALHRSQQIFGLVFACRTILISSAPYPISWLVRVGKMSLWYEKVCVCSSCLVTLHFTRSKCFWLSCPFTRSKAHREQVSISQHQSFTSNHIILSSVCNNRIYFFPFRQIFHHCRTSHSIAIRQSSSSGATSIGMPHPRW